MWPKLMLVALAGSLLSLSALTTLAQTPTPPPGTPPAAPTATPGTPPPTPPEAPTNVQYDEQTNLVTWVDNATGEEGYRIVVTINGEARTFEVGPDIQQFQIPADFRVICLDTGDNISISVTAFSGENESQPGSFEGFAFYMNCLSVTVTPGGLGPSALPVTGIDDSADRGMAFPGALALAAAAALGVGLLAALVRRRHS